MEGNQLQVKLEGLEPATKYVFQVEAENRVGRSRPSPALRYTTEQEPPSAPPRNIKVHRLIFCCRRLKLLDILFDRCISIILIHHCFSLYHFY